MVLSEKFPGNKGLLLCSALVSSAIALQLQALNLVSRDKLLTKTDTHCIQVYIVLYIFHYE